jgi:zinc protease
MLGCHKRHIELFLTLCAIFVFGACAHWKIPTQGGVEALAQREQWAHERSDLPPDPQTFFGRLPNGVRYILKENHTPSDRVSMHLYVQTGSLAEAEGEEGLAHFLEHMLFDGSTHFPPGEMVKYFQRIGMQFGPDANAHTGFAQTVYDILLPKGDAHSIAEGLLVLNDYAQGALLLPEEVEKEKKVVLAEKRSRDSTRYRTLEATIGFQVPGTLVARRLPIGKVESISAFNPDIVRRFYETWYQPERMVLVMVGDFDTQTARKLVEDQFASLKSRREPADIQKFGSFSHQNVKTFYHLEREMGATTVSIETSEIRKAPIDTAANQRKALVQALADRVVQKRLEDLVRKQNSVITSASIDSGYYLQQIRYAQISADCKPENWNEALALIEQTLRQALQFGFTASELNRARSNVRADLLQALNEEKTRESRDLAQEVLGSLGDWQVFQSPRQRMELLEPILGEVTGEEVHQAFANSWSARHRLVLVTGNADLTMDNQIPEQRILTTYQQSVQQPLAAPEEREAARFPYLPEPAQKGGVASRTVFEDLGIEQVVFANGVHLVMKKTTFNENQVLARLSFGAGQSSEPSQLPGLGLVTTEASYEAGFGAMDRISLENSLAGRLAKVSLEVKEDKFVLDAEAETRELDLLFQLFQACIQDPGYRPEALETAFKRLDQRYQALSHSVEGLMQLKGYHFLAGGDSRFGWPEWQRLRQLELDQIKSWFGSQLSNEPLELAVVGDFDPERIVDLAARYLGSLPHRASSVNAAQRPGPRFAIGSTLRLSAETKIDKSLVVVGYPTDDYWDIQRTRRLNVLAEVFSERLRVGIREKLGGSYSPYAYHRAYRAYPRYGLLQAVLLVDPQQAEVMIAETKAIAQELATRGVSPDDLRRALDPTLAQIRDMRQSNDYWINSVLMGSSRHPEQFAWARSIEQDYAGITAEEISALAKQYLVNTKAATVLIAPQDQAQP